MWPVDPRLVRAWSLARLPVYTICLVALAQMWVNLAMRPWENDLWHMIDAWRGDGPLYPVSWLTPPENGKYGYAPIFAQLGEPLTMAPWPVVSAVWSLIQLGALIWMVGPLLAFVAIIFPWPALEGYGTAVYATINNGNPMILTAAVIVVALRRWPAAWAFVFLTKSSAGIGALWYAIRGEWRKFGIAVGVTAAIALVSFVAAPELTVGWIRMWANAALVAGSDEAVAKERFVPIAMPIRSVIGLAVVAFAARRGWMWLVPVGCFLSLPDIHLGGFAVLLAVPGLWLRSHGSDVPSEDHRLVPDDARQGGSCPRHLRDIRHGALRWRDRR